MEVAAELALAEPKLRVEVTVVIVVSVLVAVSATVTVVVTVSASIVEVSVSVTMSVSTTVEAGRGSPVIVSTVVEGMQPAKQTVVDVETVAVFVTLAVFVIGLGIAYSPGQ